MVDYAFLERNFRNRKKQRDKEKNKKYLLSWWHSPPLLNQTALQFLPVHQCMLAFLAVLLPSASLLHPGGGGRRRGDWSQTALCQEKTTYVLIVSCSISGPFYSVKPLNPIKKDSRMVTPSLVYKYNV